MFDQKTVTGGKAIGRMLGSLHQQGFSSTDFNVCRYATLRSEDARSRANPGGKNHPGSPSQTALESAYGLKISATCAETNLGRSHGLWGSSLVAGSKNMYNFREG